MSLNVRLDPHDFADLLCETGLTAEAKPDPLMQAGYALMEFTAVVGNAKVTFHARVRVMPTRPPMVPQEEWECQKGASLRSEPHTVSVPSTPDAMQYALEYWGNRDKI